MGWGDNNGAVELRVGTGRGWRDCVVAGRIGARGVEAVQLYTRRFCDAEQAPCDDDEEEEESEAKKKSTLGGTSTYGNST